MTSEFNISQSLPVATHHGGKTAGIVDILWRNYVTVIPCIVTVPLLLLVRYCFHQRLSVYLSVFLLFGRIVQKIMGGFSWNLGNMLTADQTRVCCLNYGSDPEYILDILLYRYILNAVRCPYVRNGGRAGQLSSEWRHNENDAILRTGAASAASAVGARGHNENDVTMIIVGRRYGEWRHVATGCTTLVIIIRYCRSSWTCIVCCN